MTSITISIFILSAFVLSGCLTNTKPNKQHFKSDLTKSREKELKLGYVAPPESELLIYEKRNSWESPFNPHEVFRDWDKVSFEIERKKKIYLITVGNPKYDWSNWPSSKDPLLRPITDGQKISAVVFVFTVNNDKKVIMMGFEFKDDLGIINIFGWNEDVKSYVRFIHPEEQRLS